MRIEITSVSLNNKVITISAINITEENLQRIERTRDEFQQELEYQFDTTNKDEFIYIRSYLKRQKATAGSKTWGEALNSILGTITQSPQGKYRVLA